MNIVLRILVILTLVLNGVALWFATALYGKRNLLIDRNEAFRDFTVAIAKTFEAEDAPHENTAADHEARDVSDVSLASADITPDKSDFWESYKEELEKLDGKRYTIDNRKSDLDEVYVLNAEGKPELDGRGAPLMEGAPMDLLLKEIQSKALAQYKRLNNVRGELTKVRTELESTITELNEVKKQGRESLKTISGLEEQVSTLEADKARLEGDVSNLKEEITSLEEQKTSMQAEMDRAIEERETAEAEVAKLKETLEKIAIGGQTASAAGGPTAVANITAGVKGTIARVDNEYNFCLVSLSDEAYTELVGEAGDRPLPEVEYLVRRAGQTEGAIVGKIRLRTLTRDTKTLICDVLADWKQEPLQRGDEVFFLD